MKINKLVEEITNFDNLKDPKTVIDAVTGDAIETSKEAQDNFDKVAKPFKKPILGKKEDEKSPALKLDESFESDGWELEDSPLSDALEKICDLKYEIDNCVRGAYVSHATTYTELARYVIELANDLIDCANDLADSDAFDDDMDESLKEGFEFSNGDLRDFDPADLMDKVKKRQMSLFSSREFGDKLYDISIHPHGRVDDLKDVWVDIVSEDLDGNQERIFLKKFLTYDDAINAMNEWKKSMIDSASAVVEESMESINESDEDFDTYMYHTFYAGIDNYAIWKKGTEAVEKAKRCGWPVKGDFGVIDVVYGPSDAEEIYGFNPNNYKEFEEIKVPKKSVDESLNEDDGRQRRVNLTPEQRAEEKAMAATLFDRVYNELEKATDGSKNKVNKKASQRYNSEDIATDFDGNIIVYAKDKESLTNAVNVARAYQLKYKIEPGSIRNKAHAFQCVLYIPEE